MKILIADDDLTSRTMLSGILRKNGYAVLETVNGIEAINELRKPGAPRVAVLDWVMPELEGIEVVRRVKSLLTNHLPYIIMLTTRGEKSDIITGLNSGADDYLTKPFDPDELLARINVGCRIIMMQDELEVKCKELSSALDQIKTLRGIVPICMHCKKIRNDAGYWQEVEIYVHDHSEADFSHGLCNECMEKLYPDARHVYQSK